MATLSPADAPLGIAALPFDLRATDGRRYTLEDVRGPNGLVVMFICNHCPYVKAVIGKIVRDVRDLAREGVGAIAISSNDPTEYPEDSFERMHAVAAEHGFGFPYAFDESQQVARAYGAIVASSRRPVTGPTCSPAG